MLKILYSPKFVRQYKKLPSAIKDLVEEQQEVFLNNPFEMGLKTHKLHGVFSGCYAFSINYSYRIIFEFFDNNTVTLLAVGKHDIYE